MKKLNKSHILLLHQQLITEFRGAGGIRDDNLLDLSINAPYQTFDGKELYSTTIEKAVHLGFSIIKNHPFLDGNKRIGIHSMLVLLFLNDYSLDYTQEELIEIVMDIASSEKSDQDLLLWVIDHISKN